MRKTPLIQYVAKLKTALADEKYPSVYSSDADDAATAARIEMLEEVIEELETILEGK